MRDWPNSYPLAQTTGLDMVKVYPLGKYTFTLTEL
jgi:hypothetical protein